MSRPVDLMRSEVLAQPAYSVADARGMIKLDAMENPYSWPGALQQQWLGSLVNVELNRYPDPGAQNLVRMLRTAHGIPDDAGCILGNGSDELIQMLIMAVGGSSRPIVAPVPSFVMYEVLARAVGAEFIGVPLQSDFTLDMPALEHVLRERRPALFFLAHPNNPTGLCYPEAEVMRLIEINPGVTVVDEAYAPFTDGSFLPLAGQRSNLMVMRTLSKLGLAGLRLGYLAATHEWIDALERLRLPYNINSLTQHSARFALEHRAALEDQARTIRGERDRLSEALAGLPMVLRVFPSQANFLLFRVQQGQADGLFAGLRERGILIKNVSRQGGLLVDCLRVTVGSPEENTAFLEAIRSLEFVSQIGR
jgi:histidinol-phosphate aminotransferase